MCSVPMADVDFNQGGDFTFTGLDMSDDMSSARKTDSSRARKRVRAPPLDWQRLCIDSLFHVLTRH